MSRKFDLEHLALAEFWGVLKSKDPNTKVGSVLVRPNGSIASLGYNGFPRGMDDSPELYADRDTKLDRIIHAETNAISASEDRSLDGCTLYVWPFFPCHRCAVHIIQEGIVRVVSPKLIADSSWMDSWIKAMKYFDENEKPVQYKMYTQEEIDNE